MTKIILGKLIKVQNKNKKLHENDNYIAIQVENESGGDERCLLFTQIELSDMEKITFDFALNKMKAGRLYHAIFNNKQTYLLKIINDNNQEMILKLPFNKAKTAWQRSLKNPEDLTQKSFLTDLLD